ncbi:MAG TPA: amino acid adenylation domain-containing protein [Isosphaeraceae bacterium]
MADWLARRMASQLGVAPAEVDHRATFASFGLGSLQAVGLAGDLEAWLGRPLSATLAYEHPTIASLARHLAGESAEESPADASPARGEPIAIVGIGCRFPGARGPSEFWHLLESGTDATRPVPDGRWPANGQAGKVDYRRGGFLDRVDLFDADFFGISPREAQAMDPQQRLLLEVAWEAMEDAGLRVESLAGSPVGVFVGISTDDYSRLSRGGDHGSGDVYEITGNAASIAANRISYAFDFHGPSLAIDTACSSSLAAVEWACRSLRSGESSVALAGGVNLLISPGVSANFARAGFLAADGRCKSFSASADGYARGEGAGVVVLKPLTRALADDDTIYAVIRGGAINQDGRTNGLTAPSRQAQETVLRSAYRAAGIEPDRVDYVEAHGTGTNLGDPIEAAALGAVLGEDRPGDRPCRVGSVKTNIGHLEAAAGVAGLIKVALMLRHGSIPPSLHAGEPNPQIPFETLPLRLVGHAVPWPRADLPSVAGVSSFGFGGTNVHLVVEAAPAAIEARDGDGREGDVMLPLSARSPEALRDLAAAVRNALEEGGDLRDLARAASLRRDHHDHRLAVVASSPASAVAALDAFLRDVPDPRIASGRRPPGRRPRLALVFSGQGGLWWGAGRELLEREPVFRGVYETCNIEGRSLLDELRDTAFAASLSNPEFAQTHQFALQAALTALYASWGIEAQAVIGHSLGEIAAAHAAGVLGLEEALRIVSLRGRLMRSAAGRGQTAALGISAHDARSRIARYGDALAVAAVNGPGMTTVSGDSGPLQELVASLAEEGRFARLVDFDCAFHHPQLDPLRAEMEDGLRGLEPRDGSIPIVSTVTGRAIAGREFGSAYWGRNLRETVLFSDAISALGDEGFDLYLEIGPHPIHRGAIAEVLGSRDPRPAVVPSLRRDGDSHADLLRSVAQLYVRGCPVAWDRLTPAGRFVPLPSYPWQGKRYWIEEETGASGPKPSLNGQHASNGHPVVSNGRPHEPVAKPPRAGDDLFYEIRWNPADPSGPAGDVSGRWGIVGEDGGVARSLAADLESRGAEVVIASIPTAESLRSARRIVYIAPTGDDVEATATRTCGDVLRVVRSLASHPGPDRPRLWVVTCGAQPAGSSSRPLAVEQASLWGLGRSLALEHPELWGGLIDLDPEGNEGEAEALERLPLARGAIRCGVGVPARPTEADPGRQKRPPRPDRSRDDEIGTALALAIADGREDQLALRDGCRYVPRLVRRAMPATARPLPSFRPEATYLVTGGLGDLGLRVASWMVEHGARRLILLGRRGLPDRDRWDELEASDPRLATIRAMERLGATIVTVSADVADLNSMKGLFASWSKTLPPIRGIVHAAGVVEPTDAIALDETSLHAVLRPKVAGAWALHEASRALPLDVFAMFSSISSVWSSRKLAGYSAANAFLDALAHHRAALGLPALTVNWGPWDGGGMVDASGWGRSLGRMGLRALPAEEGLEALGRLLADPRTIQATAAAVDWSTFAPLYALAGRSKFLDVVAAEAGAMETSTDGLAWLGELPSGERRGALIDRLRARVAAVLRLPAGEPEDDRLLNTLGIDSLLAMELKAGIEGDLGVIVPITTFLEATTLASLADRLLAEREVAGGARHTSLVAALGDDAEHVPSYGQQSLWYAHQLSATPGAYNIAGAARVHSALDADALRRALRRLVERHPALRTTYPEHRGRPAVEVRDALEPFLQIEDATGWSEADLRRRRSDEANRPFDIETGPLLRVFVWVRSAEECDVLVVLDHVVGDFWTISLLVEELGRLYAAERSGESIELPALTLRYTDYARWQAEMLAGPEGARLEAHWRSRLAPPPPALELPTDRPRPAARTEGGGVRHLDLDGDLTRAVVDLARAREVSVYTVLLAAFQTLLGRYSGQDDFAVGSPVAGRTRAGLGGLLGYFVNLVPMRADLSGGPTFDELLGRVRATVHEGLEHQDYPYAVMVERLWRGHDPGRTPIFQAMFIYQKSQRDGQVGLGAFGMGARGRSIVVSGMTVESLHYERRASLFDLTLVAARDEEGLALALEFSADLFDAATADRMLGHYRTLLEGAVADPLRRIADLPLMTEAERAWLIGQPDDEIGGRDDLLIHHLFEAHATVDPEAIAVVHEGRRMTYLELDVRADFAARLLRESGIGPGEIVGLCIERSPALLVGLLGVLKAGSAYLPLDPLHPGERLAAMLRDAGASALLVDRASRGLVAGFDGMILVIDADDDAPLLDPAEPLPPSTTSDGLAYCIYTSGSTGAPKGVMVVHRSVVSTYAAWERAYGLDSPAGVHLQVAGPAFDVFTGDWVRALGSGGTLVIAPREVVVDPEALADLMIAEDVAFAEFVPAVVEGLMGHLERTGSRLASARLIAVGSDVWRLGQHRRLKELVGPAARVVNSYGLTEATIDSAWFEGDVPDAPDDAHAPIGRPFSGTRAYVLALDMQPLPAGLPGELFIGGPGVAIGYLGRPALTAERFLPDPFGPPGSRLYRTGDLAQWRADGMLELLGRADDQVKIRGVRVEPGEVESALLRHAMIREAAVVVREDAGERRLAGFVVAEPATAPDPAELRRWLRESLPEAMVPVSISVLDALPLSPNGKVDRRTLAAVEAAEVRREEYVAPRDEVERSLERVAREVLGVARVGVHDHFLELGFDSILVIQVASRARQAGLRFDPGLLFRHPTISSLAQAIARRPAAPAEVAATSTIDGFDRDAALRALDGGEEIEDIFPLTPVQEGMLYHATSEPDAGAYVEQFACRLVGDLDLDAFTASWRRLVERHPALRTAIHWADAERPLQAVHRRAALPMVVEDWRALDADEIDERLDEYLRDDRRRGFVPGLAPLSRLAVFRVADDSHAMVWTSHHLILDGWCLPILLSDIIAYYDAAIRGVEPGLPPSRPFRDYVAWQRRHDLTPAERYWRKALAGFDAATPLALEKAHVNGHPIEPPFAECEVALDEEATSELRAVARSEQLTLASVIQGAWAVVLARYSGREDVTIGVTVSGRPAELEGVESMVGVFINTLPLRVRIDEESPFLPWLRDVQSRLVEMRRFEATPPLKIHEWSDVPRGRPLFESIVIVQNTPVDAGLIDRAALGIERPRVHDQTNYPLTVAAIPGDRLALRIGYDARRFDGAAVARMLGHFQTLLEEIAEAPNRRLADLSMLSSTEHELLLGRWSEVGTDGPAGVDDNPDGDRNTPLGATRGTSGEARR